jgi:anti-sigma regulatory factor (Ser/Thr protein kinase)
VDSPTGAPRDRLTRTGFEHVAVVYDTPTTVATELAPVIARDLDAGNAVLVCVRDDVARAIAEVVPARERLTLLDVSARYSRPVDALHVLWQFSRAQTDAGTPRVHSIGELSFTGTDTDADWIWYEAACNSVLTDLPITATCLYDATTCPERVLATVGSTHAHVDAECALPLTDGRSTRPPTHLAAPPLPDRAPDAELDALTESRPVREVLRKTTLDDDVLARATVVFSELVTNAVKHGGGVAGVCLWIDDGAVVGRVRDGGAGIADPYATVRLPRLGEHGVGLWLSHVEATRLVVEAGADGGTTATALVAPR